MSDCARAVVAVKTAQAVAKIIREWRREELQGGHGAEKEDNAG